MDFLLSSSLTWVSEFRYVKGYRFWFTCFFVLLPLKALPWGPWFFISSLPIWAKQEETMHQKTASFMSFIYYQIKVTIKIQQVRKCISTGLNPSITLCLIKQAFGYMFVRVNAVWILWARGQSSSDIAPWLEQQQNKRISKKFIIELWVFTIFKLVSSW